MFQEDLKMKAKKIIERIIKLVNILLNMFMVFVAIVSEGHSGISGYMYSDDIYRIAWIVSMFTVVNIGDYLIRKVIREF